jgi:hypothetical protein
VDPLKEEELEASEFIVAELMIDINFDVYKNHFCFWEGCLMTPLGCD